MKIWQLVTLIFSGVLNFEFWEMGIQFRWCSVHLPYGNAEAWLLVYSRFQLGETVALPSGWEIWWCFCLLVSVWPRPGCSKGFEKWIASLNKQTSKAIVFANSEHNINIFPIALNKMLRCPILAYCGISGTIASQHSVLCAIFLIWRYA